MQSETKASQARKEHDFMEKQAMAQSVGSNFPTVNSQYGQA